MTISSIKQSYTKQICALLSLLLPAMAANAVTLDSDTTSGANYSAAAFRLWLPEPADRLRGLVVLVPGSNADGRAAVEDDFWRGFARRHQFGLVGCLFQDRPHENMNIEEYARVSAGSGQALLDAISDFAVRTKHPEVANAPLLLWGHSAGGEFNFELACWKPERILGFVVNKGGYYFTHLAGTAARQVPGIFFVGEKDSEFRVRSIRGIFAVNREAGAIWTLAVEPGAGHEVGRTRDLAVAYFESVIALGFSKTPDGDVTVATRPAPGKAWIGDVQSFEIVPTSASKGGGALTSWLPDEAFARQWMAFVRGRRLQVSPVK